MEFTKKIGQFATEQNRLIRNYYGLDYWNDHTLSEGYAEATTQFSDMVEEKMANKNAFAKFTAGASTGVIKLLGGIPIAMNEWVIETLEEVPNGPGETLYKFVEFPVAGILNGIMYVGGSVENWIGGSLDGKGSFSVGDELVSVVGTAALMLLGAKNISTGTGNFIGGFKRSLSTGLQLAGSNGTAAAAATTAGTIALAGGKNFIAGTVMMSNIDEKGPETPTTQHTPTREITTRVINGRRYPISMNKIVDMLERCGGDRSRAAKKLNTFYSRLTRLIEDAGQESPLFKFKNIKQKHVSIKKNRVSRVNPADVSNDAIATMIERYHNWGQVASHLGISSSDIAIRVKYAPVNSTLFASLNKLERELAFRIKGFDPEFCMHCDPWDGISK